jgi:bacteriocin resistance YdeI/OmpD-like protein/uncharacterized protein DUF1905
MRFTAQVELGGKTATGIQVPDEVVAALGSGKRPAVRVTVGGHTYRTTVALMGGRYLVPLSAENREAAGVAAGESVDVDIELDTEGRDIALPDDLEAALRSDERAREFFAGLSYTHRKEWARWIEDAKRPETRSARLENTLAALREGRRTR